MATTTRRATKRTATRARLLEAARALIGEGGFDAVTIAEVTERADVGFGTFYGYFESKDAVVRAVILDAMTTLAEANDALTTALDDPAEVVATAIRHTLATVDGDAVFAGFIVRVALSADEELWGALRDRMRRDIDLGVRAGRFTVDDRRRRRAHDRRGGARRAAGQARRGARRHGRSTTWPRRRWCCSACPRPKPGRSPPGGCHEIRHVRRRR